MRHEANITYFRVPAKVACDGKCKKAWGRNTRPRNPDDTFKQDRELGIAPLDPGTYEGGYAKPVRAKYFPNKWCVRECERCVKTPYENPDAELVLPVF
jgi:hypothetical protein